MKKLSIILFLALIGCKKEPVEYPPGMLVQENLDNMNKIPHIVPPLVIESEYADYKKDGKKYWVHDQNCFRYNTMWYQIEKYTGKGIDKSECTK